MKENMQLALEFAREELGTKEVPGKGNNPVIIQYGKTAGIPDYSADSIPWCAVFVGAMLAKADIKNSGSALARSYMNWGRAVERPYPGCIAVFKRGNSTWQGHVGFFDGYTKDGKIKLLGGNQSNRVSIVTRSDSNLLGYREATGASPMPAKEIPTPAPAKPKRPQVDKSERPRSNLLRLFQSWFR